MEKQNTDIIILRLNRTAARAAMQRLTTQTQTTIWGVFAIHLEKKKDKKNVVKMIPVSTFCIIPDSLVAEPYSAVKQGGRKGHIFPAAGPVLTCRKDARTRNREFAVDEFSM